MLVVRSLFHKYNWLSLPKKTYSTQSLDFGCGRRPRNPFGANLVIGVDTAEFIEPESTFDSWEYFFTRSVRGQSLPFEDNEFDFLTAFDVLEHLSREPQGDGNEFIFAMNEFARVLKPGGLFLAVTPAFPSEAAFQDPTHVNIISKETIKYFDGVNAWAKELGYGYKGNLRKVSQFWLLPSSPITGRTLFGDYHKYDLGNIINTTRSFFSAIIRPTHLVWLMEKVSE